jgi:hypothetical protein
VTGKVGGWYRNVHNKRKVGGWYWHVHHGILADPLTEPLRDRVRRIEADKPKSEVETRLRLMKPVRGKLPKAYAEAWKAYVEAGGAYVEARKAYVEAGEAYVEATKAYVEAGKAPELLALHAKECPNCPWDGRTIFPKEP